MSPPAPVGPINELPGNEMPGHEPLGEFEQHARALLEDSVQRVDGRIRSRLNQARHAAIEESSRRPALWRRFSLMPAASAVAAAALVAFVLWPHSHSGDSLNTEASGRASMEDLDLLADGDALDLVSDESTDAGQFYEWAVDQSDSNEASSTGA
jgi:ferric-dicitrate binding protein FerR (iron transport regulator)